MAFLALPLALHVVGVQLFYWYHEVMYRLSSPSDERQQNWNGGSW